MTLNLSGKALPKFPTRVNQGVGLDITKSGGIWTFALDYTDVPLIGGPGGGFIAVQLPDGTFGKIPASSITGLFSGAEQVKTTGYPVVPADAGAPLVGNAAGPITFDLPPLGTSTAGYLIRNIGAGTLTLDPNGAELIEGAATAALVQGQGALIWPGFDGWRMFEPAQNLLTKANTWTAAQTFNSTINVTGGSNLQIAGTNIFARANTWTAQQTFTSTAGVLISVTGGNPSLLLKDNDPGDASSGGQVIGSVVSQGQDSLGNNTTYMQVLTRTDNVTDGSESAYNVWRALRAGATADVFAVGDGAYAEGPAPGRGYVGALTGFKINGTDIFARANTFTAAQTISGTGTSTLFTTVTTDAGAATFVAQDIYRDSASPAASDTIGDFQWNGRDSAANKQYYAGISVIIDDPTSTSEDASIVFGTIVAGGIANRWRMGAGIFYQGGTDQGAGSVNLQSLYVNGTDIFARANTWTAAQTFSTAGNNSILQIVSSDAGAAAAENLNLYRNSASPAAADNLESARWDFNDSGANRATAGSIRMILDDPTDTSEDATFIFNTIVAGANSDRWRLGAGIYYSGGADQGVGTININTGGLFVAATKVVGARDTGWTAMTNTANKNTAYDTTTVTLPQLASRVKSIQDALTTHGLLGA